MSQATLDYRWVPKSACPLKATVEAVEDFNETFKGKPYTTFRLLLNAGGQFYQYDAKFGDKNFMINCFGSDTEKWLNQEITIEVDPETTYKRIALRK